MSTRGFHRDDVSLFEMYLSVELIPLVDTTVNVSFARFPESSLARSFVHFFPHEKKGICNAIVLIWLSYRWLLVMGAHVDVISNSKNVTDGICKGKQVGKTQLEYTP